MGAPIPGKVMAAENVLIWLPSPMGDAVLCTPALRAIRRHLSAHKIWFLANSTVKQLLQPCDYNDLWLQQERLNPIVLAVKLARCRFHRAILFKNSFASALTVFLAGIPGRAGYAREGRGFMLTERLYPPKLDTGGYKPISMVEYYLRLAGRLGAQTQDTKLELCVEPADERELLAKLPAITHTTGPLVILVPGGAFGPSKCWPSERFARVADWLITSRRATVVVSVAPDPVEKRTARSICTLATCRLISLGETALTVGQVKALFARAALIITNDTGPRHLGIALKRKVVTMFGPNDPAWTDTHYPKEIQLVPDVPCAPCQQSHCKQSRHFCMEAISVEMVCRAAAELLDKPQD